MPQADVSSLVEVSIAFNFAYAFIRGLSTYEISKREAKCDEIFPIAERTVTESARRQELVGEKRHFDLGVKRARLKSEGRVSIAIRVCSFFGFVGIIYLLITGLNVIAFASWVKGVVAVTLISAPFLAILVLKISLKEEMKEVDKRFSRIRHIALGW